MYDDDDGGGGDDYRFALLMMNDEWMIESSGAIKRDELQNKSKDGVKVKYKYTYWCTELKFTLLIFFQIWFKDLWQKEGERRILYRCRWCIYFSP